MKQINQQITGGLSMNIFSFEHAIKMKKLYFILCFQLLLGLVHAQVVPKGISYQAVAHNLKGDLLPNQKVSLKIYLFGNENNTRHNHYSETHEVSTNGIGLFNLIIGEGVRSEGNYGTIPWSTENIWLEIAIKDKGQSGFSTVTNSKLLAVPYAFYAQSANQIIQPGKASQLSPPEPGVVSTQWSVFGNANTNSSGNPYHINSLGTTDKVDLFLISDNVERFRILKNGDITTKLNFEIGQNLKVGQSAQIGLTATIDDSLVVKKNVFFNTDTGVTINYGPFTVAKGSPSLLSGKLTVDQATDLNAELNVDGPTDLNDRLNVNNMSPTKLTGTLQVDSSTVLNDALNVNQASPTALTGTLEVDSCATFHDKVKILSIYSTDTSGIAPSGSLQVGGGAFIKENLYIGGVAKFGGPVAFGGAVSITDGTQSVSPGTGALKVTGGTGIGLNLNVGGASVIAGMLTILDPTESIDSASGALKVLGGVGIRRRLNVQGATSFSNTLTIGGVTELNNTLFVKSSGSFIANFSNGNISNGISIQVNNAVPEWANNYMEFRNSSSGVVGYIEGENSTQLVNNGVYYNEIEKLNFRIHTAELAIVIAGATLLVAGKSLIGALASSTGCAGLGFCATAPIASLIVKATFDVGGATADLINNSFRTVDAIADKDAYIAYKAARVGVTYESGAGDYAEWLPKANAEETFLPGYIVGLKNGFISKQTSDAQKHLVISTQPIVLGNTPSENLQSRYEKIAFLGQVPVRVLGRINAGDYIVPSGNHDGLGRGIAPDKIKMEDFAQIVGVAWSANAKEGYGVVQVAVGLNGSDINKKVVEQKNRIQQLREKFDQRNQLLAQLVPGYQEMAGYRLVAGNNSDLPGSSLKSSPGQPSIHDFAKSLSYFEFSKEQLSDILNQAQALVNQKGNNLEADPFWAKIATDQAYRQTFIEEIQKSARNELPRLLELNLQRINTK